MQMPPPHHGPGPTPVADGPGHLHLSWHRNPVRDQPEALIEIADSGLAFALDIPALADLINDLSDMLLQMRTAVAEWFEAEIPGDDHVHLVHAAQFDHTGLQPARRMQAACGLVKEPRAEWLFAPFDLGQEPCLEHTCPACLHAYHAPGVPQATPQKKRGRKT